MEWGRGNGEGGREDFSHFRILMAFKCLLLMCRHLQIYNVTSAKVLVEQSNYILSSYFTTFTSSE